MFWTIATYVGVAVIISFALLITWKFVEFAIWQIVSPVTIGRRQLRALLIKKGIDVATLHPALIPGGVSWSLVRATNLYSRKTDPEAFMIALERASLLIWRDLNSLPFEPIDTLDWMEITDAAHRLAATGAFEPPPSIEK